MNIHQGDEYKLMNKHQADEYSYILLLIYFNEFVPIITNCWTIRRLSAADFLTTATVLHIIVLLKYLFLVVLC